MKLILFICMVLGSGITNSQEYQKNHADASIRFNYSMIENAIARLSNTGYFAQYVTRGMVCSSPDITVSTGKISTSMFGDVISNNGDTHLSTKGRFGVGMKLDDCGSWAIGGSCSLVHEFTDLSKTSRVGGACIVSFGPFIFRYFIGDTIDPIIQKPPEFPIQLTDTESMKMEFGSFIGGAWQPAKDRHKKVISYWANIGVMTSQSIPLNGIVKGETLAMDVSIGKNFYNTTTDKQDYREHYLYSGNFDSSSDLFQLKIDQSMFLKHDSAGNTSGLMGEILPLRVKGKLDGNEVDVVLEGADVKYGTLGKEKVIVIGAKVKSVSKGAFIEDAEGIITLSQPAMEEGELVTYIKRFELNMETKCFFFSFCLNGSLLDHFESRRLVITKLSGKVELEVPNCINMNDNRWEPRGRLCPDGTIGRQDTSKKSTRITPLFDQSRVNIDGYAMTITVPAKVENYNPPREEIKGYMAIPDDLRKIAEELVIPENSYIQGIEEDIE